MCITETKIIKFLYPVVLEYLVNMSCKETKEYIIFRLYYWDYERNELWITESPSETLKFELGALWRNLTVGFEAYLPIHV